MKTSIDKYWQPTALLVLTVVMASLFARIDVDPHHQGIMFKPALDVAHGQMLFRDTYTQYGALTTLLQAWALRIFGDYLVVIQLQTAVFYGLIAFCLWHLWARIVPVWLVTFSVFIWVLMAPYYVWTFHPWSSVYALFFQLFSLVLLLRALHQESRFQIVLAGAAAVLAFWCRQPVGVFHCVVMAIFLATTPLVTGVEWRKALRDSAYFIAGIIAGSLPFLLWLVANNALHDMYLQSIKVAIAFGTNVGSHGAKSSNFLVAVLEALTGRHPWFFNYTYIWTLLPLVCLVFLGILLTKARRNLALNNNHLALYGLLAVSFGSWMQYYPRPDVAHCYWAATPMFGVLACAVWNGVRFRREQVRIAVAATIMVGLFGFDIGYRAYVGNKRLNQDYVKIEEPMVLRGMSATPRQASGLYKVSQILNAATEQGQRPLLNFSPDYLYLTFVGPQKNFHPMYNAKGAERLYPDFNARLQEYVVKERPLVLGTEGMNLPGARCVEVFGIYSINSPRRLTLYSYEAVSQTGSDSNCSQVVPVTDSYDGIFVPGLIRMWRQYLGIFKG